MTNSRRPTLDDVQPVETDPVVRLETVSLTELNSQAALQTRVDRKYLLAERDLAGLFDGLNGTARVLEVDGRQRFGYTSTYFDTPTFDSYLDAARSRPNRFKVRTRTYLDSDIHFIEVKTRSRARHTIKTRRPATADDHGGLTPANQGFVAQTLTHELPVRPMHGQAATIAALCPALSTHYQRTTLLVEPSDPEPSTTPVPSRATIDTSLAFTAPGHTTRSHPGLTIIETKTAGPPSPMDQLLWQSGHRPVKVSKYGIGLALMHPYLPAAKWNRILRHHFGWQPESIDHCRGSGSSPPATPPRTRSAASPSAATTT